MLHLSLLAPCQLAISLTVIQDQKGDLSSTPDEEPFSFGKDFGFCQRWQHESVEDVLGAMKGSRRSVI